MAVTVTTDLVVRHAMDSATDTAADGNVLGDIGTTSTTTKVQGTAAVIFQHKGIGVGWASAQFTAANLSDLHVLAWVNNLDNVDTLANGGWRIRVASNNGNMASAWGEWNVAGQAETVRAVDGYARFCADVLRPFDATAGTPPAASAIGAIAIVEKALTNSGQNTHFGDSRDSATGITVGGGTGADPGKSAQVASNDRTNGRGLFRSISAAYYILGRVTIGSTSADSEFTDSNEVWIFDDQPVSATFHRLEFVGAGGFTNNAKFGTKTGTGIAAEGAGGNTLKATGVAPFRITATDANITVGLYGCSFINPPSIREDAFRAVLNATSADVYSDVTRPANNAAASDFNLTPTGAASEKVVFGHGEPFSEIKINVGTAGTGTVTLIWEYWNGSSWAALTNVTDGTNSFKTAGTNTVTYAVPSDWATTTLSTFGPYFYIRARIPSGESYTIDPLGTQCFARMGGRVRWEQANAEAIRCTFTNMDTVVVRNGAFLKKCTIANSVAPGKSAALDLGASDPATDTVRDLTIQNCTRGILLRPTASATYNFRNIKFSGNTSDVRVDAPGGATVTINVLEGGDTPSVQNVNGSTIVINNSVTLTVTAKDEAGAAIQNARVSVRKTSDNTEVLGGLTNASGVVSGSFNFVSNTDVSVRVRKSSGGTDYVPVNSPQTITSSGLNVLITMIEDPINTN